MVVCSRDQVVRNDCGLFTLISNGVGIIILTDWASGFHLETVFPAGELKSMVRMGI